jgi:hypothetical protein
MSWGAGRTVSSSAMMPTHNLISTSFAIDIKAIGIVAETRIAKEASKSTSLKHLTG